MPSPREPGPGAAQPNRKCERIWTLPSQVKDSATLNGSIAGGAITAGVVTNFKDVKAGWTAGAGIEGALGNGWSAKVEYLYIDLGKTEQTAAASVTGAGVGTLFATNANQTFRDTDNIVRVGLNYKFGGGY